MRRTRPLSRLTDRARRRWAALAGVLVLGSLGVALFGFSLLRESAPSLMFAPGAEEVVTLAGGTHALGWQGPAHRAQPSFDELDLTVRNESRGLTAEARGESITTCNRPGWCSLGSLVVPEDGPYEVRLIVRSAHPDGSLTISQTTSESATRRSPILGTIGLSAAALFGMIAIAFLWRRVR